MTTTDDRLGGRLPLADPGALTEQQRSLFEHLQEHQIPWATRTGFQSRTSGGRLIGPFNPSLSSPGVGAGLIAFMEAESASTSLTTRTRQVVILAVGAVWQAGYELHAHSAEARKVGLAENVIAALAAGEIPDQLSEAELAAGRLARQLASERRVEDAVYAAALDAFGEQGLVDLVLLTGYYQTVCGLLNAFEIPVPDVSDTDC